ncbi:PIG-L deacetylase family protein [Variovorax sp. YR752]|uniref:PIG-L deacetylase family protein n=1 Tax=Variovorax sp. YR752 TaxID=1884383 RepID=UPI0031383BFD
MLKLQPLAAPGEPLHVLCIGAHSDDIEIGCAGTLLEWLGSGCRLKVSWMVLTGEGQRRSEATRSARALLRRAESVDYHFGAFRDGFLPAQYEQVKAFFEHVRQQVSPGLVFTHRLEDRHQDHRMAAELTWNTWRDQMVLEYEIPKYEGDLGQPNLYVPLSAQVARRKASHLQRHFGTQRSKAWFSEDTFLGLSRLRGIECRAEGGHAEAFHVRKACLAVSPSAGRSR